jgi:hypothetical protein
MMGLPFSVVSKLCQTNVKDGNICPGHSFSTTIIFIKIFIQFFMYKSVKIMIQR